LCKDPKLDCLYLKSCNKAVCIDSGVACLMECGPNVECAMMMSYPGQISCNTGSGGPGGSTPSGTPGSTPGGSGT